MIRKALYLVGLATTYISSTAAHTNETYHMMDGWHGTMWGGGLFMLLLWVLVILAIIYLGQKILQNSNMDEEE